LRSSSFQSKLEGILEGKSVSLMQGERLRSRPSSGSRVVAASLPAVGVRPLQKAGGLLYSITAAGSVLSLLLLPIVLRNL